MWDLFTIYVKVEGNKSIAKEGGMSFDFEIDVWASQSSTPRFDDVLVQYQFPVVRPGAPPCSYSVAYALDVRSPDSMRHTARSTDRCGLNVNIIASVALNANMSNGEFQNLARYISSRVIVYDCFDSTALTLHQA